jgi:hypothetical protein
MKAGERAVANLVVEGDEPSNHAHYEEYVRGFDEIPVLNDAVRIPPRREPPPNFVRGERRSLRREERPDGYSQREASLAEIETHYREYSAPTAVRAKRATTSSKKRRGGRRRKKSGAAS